MGVAILATLTSLKTKQKYILSLQKELFIQAKATEGVFFFFLGLAKKTAIEVLRVYFSWGKNTWENMLHSLFSGFQRKGSAWRRRNTFISPI